jgi:hypothetical protein
MKHLVYALFVVFRISNCLTGGFKSHNVTLLFWDACVNIFELNETILASLGARASGPYAGRRPAHPGACQISNIFVRALFDESGLAPVRLGGSE